jgi:hypothetical protein
MFLVSHPYARHHITLCFDDHEVFGTMTRKKRHDQVYEQREIEYNSDEQREKRRKYYREYRRRWRKARKEQREAALTQREQE